MNFVIKSSNYKCEVDKFVNGGSYNLEDSKDGATLAEIPGYFVASVSLGFSMKN